MKKTAGATDCFRFVSLPLICQSSSGQTATSGSLQACRCEITMSRCSRCPDACFPRTYICQHLVLAAAAAATFVWLLCHVVEAVQALGGFGRAQASASHFSLWGLFRFLKPVGGVDLVNEIRVRRRLVSVSVLLSL